MTGTALTGPVKRVTLWVRDADASLRLYRDALGLHVIEDKRVQGAAIGKILGLESASLRIVHLASGDESFGWIGLYEVTDAKPQPLSSLPVPKAFPMHGIATVVLTTGAMQEVFPKVEACAGVRVLTAPMEYVKTTPGDTTPPGRYSEAIFFDADGIAVSLIGFAPLT